MQLLQSVDFRSLYSGAPAFAQQFIEEGLATHPDPAMELPSGQDYLATLQRSGPRLDMLINGIKESAV
jgi:hypothetical protein